MKPFIEAHHVTETEVHHLVAEASELRLLPGCWPKQIQTTLGNCQPFICTGADATKAIYLQANGCLKLTVFND